MLNRWNGGSAVFSCLFAMFCCNSATDKIINSLRPVDHVLTVAVCVGQLQFPKTTHGHISRTGTYLKLVHPLLRNAVIPTGSLTTVAHFRKQTKLK